MPITGASEIIPGLFRDNGGAFVNVKHPDFGALGNGAANDTAAIQAALDTGLNVLLPPGTYKAVGLTWNTAGQVLFSLAPKQTFITKNGNGVILAGTARDQQIIGIDFRGASASFTGHNVTFTGDRCSMLNCASSDAAGRAVKATGNAFAIWGTCGIYSTADLTATGYDIELGVSGTNTLYHEIHGYYSSTATGGILLTDCGSQKIIGGQFGKLKIASGTAPAGSNAGNIVGARILGAVDVNLSNGAFSACEFGNVAVTFGTGTTGITLDKSNGVSASTTFTNNGNTTANIMERVVSTGVSGTLQVKYGDDTTYCIVEYTLAASGAGTLKAPQMRIPNNASYYLEQTTAAGTVGAQMVMSSGDNLSITNLVAEKTINYTVTGTTSGARHQFVANGAVKLVADPSGVRIGTASDVAITRHMSATTTWDPPSLLTATQQSTTVTVTGAVLGNEATCSFSLALSGTRMWAEVTAADTVTVYHRNDTGGTVDIGSGTLRANVWKR